MSLDDGLRRRCGWGADQRGIEAESVVVRPDGKETRFTLNEQGTIPHISLSRNLRSGRDTLVVDFANAVGLHVLHPRLDLECPPRQGSPCSRSQVLTLAD